MRLEIVGHPGSGKSFFCLQTGPLDKRGGEVECVDPRGVWQRGGLWGRLLLSCRWPRLTSFIFLTALSAKGCRLSHLRSAYSVQRRFHGISASVCSCRHRDGVKVFDEGPLHGIYVALYGTQMTHVSRFFLGKVVGLSIGQLDGVVHLRASRQQCTAALRSRLDARQLRDLDASFDWYDELLMCVRTEAGLQGKAFLEIDRASSAELSFADWCASERRNRWEASPKCRARDRGGMYRGLHWLCRGW